MQHLTLKAVVQTTDQGIFSAVISTEDVDRENDVVLAEAMVKAVSRWPRPIPLLWEHSGAEDDIFGAIDPQSARAVSQEVVADGSVDMDSERGQKAWPLMKRGVIGFSFGYLIPDGGAVKRADGIREIRELDIFEITATLRPMNNGTRVLDTKAAGTKQLVSTLRESLEGAGRERFGSDDNYVYVDDFDPTGKWVVFCVSADNSESTYTQVQYAVQQDGSIDLDAGETEVVRTTSYRPKGEPATSEPKSARSDRELRERSRQAVLEIQSDGASLRKPPEPEAPTQTVEPASELELKRASRQVMLELLTGDAA